MSFGTNADGTPRKFGQLSRAEQKEVLTQVAAKLKAEFEDPLMQARMARILNTDTPQRAS